jgi:hypothetical protein
MRHQVLLLPAVAALTLVGTGAGPAPPLTWVHCSVGSQLKLLHDPGESAAPPCPFALDPGTGLAIAARSQAVLEGPGLRRVEGPVALPAGPSLWRDAAPLAQGPSARAWLVAQEETDLGVLMSLSTSVDFREGRADDAFAALDAALAEHPGHRGLLALRDARQLAQGLELTGTHRQAPDTTASTAGSGGDKLRNVHGTDDRQAVTSTEYPWRTIGKLAGSKCTGFLVGDRYVLTAAHCVWDKGRQALLTDVGPFLPNATGGRSTHSARVTRAWVSQGYKDGSGGADWAVVELDASLGDTYGWLGLANSTVSSVSRARTSTGREISASS